MSTLPRAGEGPAGRRGEWGERGGGRRAVVPHLSYPGGQPVVPGSAPLRRQRIPSGYTCSAGAVGQPRAPGAAWPAVGRSALRGGGGGGRCAAPPPRGLGRGLFPHRPLHTALECRRRAPGLLRALRERAGARLAALGVQQCVPRSWLPPLGAAALSGGLRGRRPPGRPMAVSGPGGERGGRGGEGVSRGPSPVPSRRSPAAWWSRSRGAGRRRGGAFVSCPAPSFGRQAVVPPPNRVVPVGRGGGGGGSAVAGPGGSGQWLAASGLRGPAAPYLLWLVGDAPLGQGARPCSGGVPRHWSFFIPLRPSPGTAGRGRCLRRRLRGGWGCSGSGFCRQ